MTDFKTDSNAPAVLLLDDNLMSATRVENQLRAAGARVKMARSLPPEGDWALVVVNLGSRSLEGLVLLAQVQERFPGAALWGFAGHREVDIWRAAKEAGVGKMISNEAAMSELGALARAFFELDAQGDGDEDDVPAV